MFEASFAYVCVTGGEKVSASLLACAWGRPSQAFGALGRPFDGPRHIARLPGPPYHFMSRVTRIGRRRLGQGGGQLGWAGA